MNRKVRDTIGQYNMIGQGDVVYAAVSGGADSVALLCALRALAPELPFTLRALHLNHNLRGEESLRDERFVRRLCRQWQIPLCVGSADVAAQARRRGQTVEQCARHLRYAFFRQQAGRGKIATAHTASDNVETVLLNLARGSGLRGLRGIPPVRGKVIRPLIACSREEIEGYCAAHRLRYVTDSSNLTDDYTRNRLRRYAVPVLREQNPRLEETVTAMTRILAREDACLESFAKRALEDIRLEGNRLGRDAFLAQPGALRPRLLRRLLAEQGVRYDRARLALLEQQIAKGMGGVQLSGDLALHCKRDCFFLSSPNHKPPPSSPHHVEMPPLGEVALPIRLPFRDKMLHIYPERMENINKKLNNYQNEFKNLLDCDRIVGIVNLRHRMAGDTLAPVGRGLTKPVRKLMGEARIPPHLRDSLLLMADSLGVLWLEGFGVRQSAAADSASRRVVRIEVTEG